jgi:NADPH2 dehydrogenase
MASDYYAQSGISPGTLLITEATFILLTHPGHDANAPGIFSPAQIACWREIPDAVHAKGSFIFCQLWALGRAARPHELQKKELEMLSSSGTPMTADGAVPRPMTKAEIWSCVSNFARAARSAVENAGFNGVEIHAANGYLIDRFTQDTCDSRTDDWGGGIEKQARFAIEETNAVVQAAGAERVGIPLSPWSPFQGMKMRDPRPQFEYLISELGVWGWRICI